MWHTCAKTRAPTVKGGLEQTMTYLGAGQSHERGKLVTDFREHINLRIVCIHEQEKRCSV
jgi:hypothetical protein